MPTSRTVPGSSKERKNHRSIVLGITQSEPTPSCFILLFRTKKIHTKYITKRLNNLIVWATWASYTGTQTSDGDSPGHRPWPVAPPPWCPCGPDTGPDCPHSSAGILAAQFPPWQSYLVSASAIPGSGGHPRPGHRGSGWRGPRPQVQTWSDRSRLAWSGPWGCGATAGRGNSACTGPPPRSALRHSWQWLVFVD